MSFNSDDLDLMRWVLLLFLFWMRKPRPRYVKVLAQYRIEILEMMSFYVVLLKWEKEN